MWTLHHTGLRILQLYAPYLPHVTEVIAEALYLPNGSIHTTNYHELQTAFSFLKNSELMKKIILITAEVRKLKTNQQLSIKTELELLTINCQTVQPQDIMPHEQIIKGITQAKAVQYSNKSHESVLIQAEGLYKANVCI